MNILNKIYTSIFGFIELQELAVKILIAVAIFAAFKILSAVLVKKSGFFIGKILKNKKQNLVDAVISSMEKPLKIFLMMTGIYLALLYIPFSVNILVWLKPLLMKIYRISIVISASIFLQSFIGNIPSFSERFADKKNKTIFTFFINIGKVLVIALTVVILLNEFNFDISGLIAGLGLGGLTFALAAQDTASNFFSGLVILFDKPFGIGDWISVGSMEGVVEEMNFRSCRIRTFDNALIAVPNSKLSSDFNYFKFRIMWWI